MYYFWGGKGRRTSFFILLQSLATPRPPRSSPASHKPPLTIQSMEPLGCSTCCDPLQRVFTVARPKSPIFTVNPSCRKMSEDYVKEPHRGLGLTLPATLSFSNKLRDVTFLTSVLKKATIVCQHFHHIGNTSPVYPFHNTLVHSGKAMHFKPPTANGL